jgi:predicted helicase
LERRTQNPPKDRRKSELSSSSFLSGVVTARDEWVYAHDRATLKRKVRFLVDIYNADRVKIGGKGSDKRIEENLDYSIKWTRAVKNDIRNGVRYEFSEKMIIDALYRPFVKMQLYFSQQLNEMQYQLRDIFGSTNENTALLIDAGAKAFSTIATPILPDYHANGDSICFSLCRFANGHRIDNITDWALEQFCAHYDGNAPSPHPEEPAPAGVSKGEGARQAPPITKDAIFHYIYGVLHDPIYREKYALNFKREFPRIPFYADFWKWAGWGEKLMALHVGYETVAPWPLKRIDTPEEKSRKAGLEPKALLRANKEIGNIQLDTETQLIGVPPAAWDYRLGNRSALEWILDQYKEKTPKDPTIREKFNTYRFADHKEKVIDLLKRVTRVSVETMKIVEAMRVEKR